MFQNIRENVINSQNVRRQSKEDKGLNLFSNVFDLKYIPMYIVSFMIGMVGIDGGYSPFSISLMAACIGNSIPILGIVLAGIVGNAIGFGLQGAIYYLFITLLFVVSIFIFKPRYNEEEKNEKIKVAKNIFISTFIIQLVNVSISGFTVYDVLSTISLSTSYRCIISIYS